MTHPTPTPEQLDAARYAAWQRMRRETTAINTGDPTIDRDLPHVAAWIAAHTRYQAEIALHPRSALAQRRAREHRLTAEAAYVDAILPDELARITTISP